jgi:hypothetical protein
MNEQMRAEIERAVVTLLAKGGRGILVNGGVVLTAAHCVEYKTEGEMILGDFFLEDIETSQGDSFKIEPYAVEPVSDLAALGATNIPELIQEVVKFANFCEKTKPVTLCLKPPPIGESYPIYIYTHKGMWVKGCGYGTDTGIMFFDAEAPIEGGTSGSPIVDDSGELVGIVLNANESAGTCTGSGPSLIHALPVWILAMIRDAGE